MSDVEQNGIPDLDGMTTAQRAAVALELIPQFLAEVQESEEQVDKRGPGRPPSQIGIAAAKAAKAVGIGKTSVNAALAIRNRDPRIIERMASGELNVAQAARAVGLFGLGGGPGRPLVGTRDSLGRVISHTHYGRGDKWKEAVGPLVRYLSGWERRNYEFRHVAPKEARRRLALITELQEKLDAAKADLEQRAHSATLTISHKR